ncbi:MAG: homocysteine S-methyltransferase family protein [Actinomycetota bacterium]
MSITILDGGMGKELRRIGAPFRQPEWSALALIEDPDAVVQAHRNFIDAGAEVITTNNYAVVPYHLGDDDFDARGAELVELAGRLARDAVDGTDVLVAGSMPPLFGSYEPQHVDPVAAAPRYRTIAASLSPHVDIWLAETLSTCVEVHSIMSAIEDVEASEASACERRSVWVGFCFPDRWNAHGVALRSGESAGDIAAAIAPHVDRIEAVLVNCTIPEQTDDALGALHREFAQAGLDVRTGAYANAFPLLENPTYRANNTILERRTDLTPDRYVDFARRWVAAGVSIVGGCCDMYPDHIAALADAFAKHGETENSPT